MRQSTLGFGRGAGSRAKGDEEAGGEKEEEIEESAAPPAKRNRRAAASKSEAKSKLQMQMTLAQNGKLHRNSPEEKKRAVPSPDELDEEVVHVETKRKTAPVKAPEPISLSVKGTLADPTQVPSFFAKRQPAAVKEDKQVVPVSNGLSALVKQKWPQPREAPWPDASSVHVQPDDAITRASYNPSSSKIPRRRRVRSTPGESDCDLVFLWARVSHSGPSSRPEAESVRKLKDAGKSSYDEEELPLNGSMPAAVRRLKAEAPNVGKVNSDALWVDRWRPVRADQVLGNESRAIYLRDWLKELEVTAEVKAGKVIKRVEKRRKKPKEEDLDGFIVDDEEEEEAWFDHFRKPMPGGAMSDDVDASSKTEDRRDFLMNAIVLQGPTGSGKTAAVYACAAELGFEVFEIYPGSGRRSGKDLGHAVGNLGRNHMVSSGGVGGGATWKGSKVIKSIGESGAPRQSLILLEEVDLLYEEDKGFWPAVVELVSTSRRPVVMTCNDPSCIPYGTLPIQDILEFEAPNEDEAASYLRMMALYDGHQLPKGVERTLYRNTAGEEGQQDTMSQWTVPASGPINLDTSLFCIDKVQGTKSSADLRQAIMQLQYFCRGNLSDDAFSSEISTRKPSSSLKVRMNQAERRSYCDAVIRRPFERVSEIQEPDEYESSANDVQLQHATFLHKPQVKMEVTTLAMLSREEDYHQALLHDQDLTSFYLPDYDESRWMESQRVSQLMDVLMASEHLRLPSWVPVVEVAPLIANMILVDDNEQATYQARLTKVLQDVKENYDEGGLKAASNSLLEMGIRPSRHKMRILLARNGDGTLALSKQETAPCRWFELSNDVLQSARESHLALKAF